MGKVNIFNEYLTKKTAFKEKQQEIKRLEGELGKVDDQILEQLKGEKEFDAVKQNKVDIGTKTKLIEYKEANINKLEELEKEVGKEIKNKMDNVKRNLEEGLSTEEYEELLRVDKEKAEKAANDKAVEEKAAVEKAAAAEQAKKDEEARAKAALDAAERQAVDDAKVDTDNLLKPPQEFNVGGKKMRKAIKKAVGKSTMKKRPAKRSNKKKSEKKPKKKRTMNRRIRIRKGTLKK